MTQSERRAQGIVGVLLTLLAALGIMTACVAAEGQVDIVCPVGQLACDGECVDPSSNEAHCGFCNSACAAASTCSGGECLAADGSVVEAVKTIPGVCAPGQLNCAENCVAGETKCGAHCVNLALDAAHCGTCNSACGATEVCNAGFCGCAVTDILCGASCANLQADVAHCGACDSACAARQECNLGSCECPAGELFCTDTCQNPMTDAANCGGCGNACMGGKICNLGVCECAVGQTLCAEICVDTQADDLNCGVCGTECMGGQTCQAGSCACPQGQTQCGGTCADIAEDDFNCGACGTICSLGEACTAGACAGGALGDDGCSGVAQGITIDGASLYQTVELPIVRDGAEVQVRDVDVVAGRQTLVRVFANVADGWSARQLSARLFLGDGKKRSIIYTKAPQRVTASSFDEPRGGSFDAARASTFEFMVGGLDANNPDQVVITEATQYAIELVECGAAPNMPVLSPRFPLVGAAEMGAVNTGPLRLRFVPLRSNNITADASEATVARYVSALRATYPSAEIQHTTREPVDIENPEDWEYNLDFLRNLRAQDAAEPDVYYYGLLKPTQTFRDFCGDGCVAGVGYVIDGIGRGSASQRVSLGLAYGDGGIETMLHELGHNLGRAHAPCAPGGRLSGVDPNYPHEGAKIGVRGYNLLLDQLISEESPDIMAYCDEPWFSDYTYKAMLNRILSVNTAQQSQARDAARAGDFRVLLIAAGKAASWGFPVTGVAAGAAESALIRNAQGTIVDNVQVYRTAISEVDAFSIQVPAPKPGWHSVQVHGHAAIPFSG